MISGKFTGILFALAVIILLQTSFDVSQADGEIAGQLWYYVLDDYFTNPNFTPVLNWTQEVGVRRQIFAVCNATFDGINKTCPQAFSTWTFTPDNGPISSSNYTNLTSGGWKYPANIPGIANPQNPRYISFYRPGLYKLEAIGFCPGWGGSWKPIVGYITVTNIQNLTTLPSIQMQNELDSPYVYGGADWSQSYFQWKSPNSGVGVVATGKYHNPYDYPIQIGYMGMVRTFVWKYNQIFNDDNNIYTTDMYTPILDVSALDDSMGPISPVTTLLPGESKSTPAWNSMIRANITNCTTVWRPYMPIVKYINYVYGTVYVMMKPLHPNFEGFWVPMQMFYYSLGSTAGYSNYTNDFETLWFTFDFKEVPMTDTVNFKMPEYNRNTNNDTFIYTEFRNTTYPYCWYEVNPED